MRVELIQSLGKFQAHTIDIKDVVIGDYYADVTETITGNFRWSYSIMFSNNPRKGQDLTINGWTFNRIVTLRKSSSFYDNYFNSFDVEGLSPEGDEFCLSFSNILRDLDNVEAVFNTIYLISCCDNVEQARILTRIFTYYPIYSDLTNNQDYIIRTSNEHNEAFAILEKMAEKMPDDSFFAFVKRCVVKKMKSITNDLIKYCSKQ